MNDLAFDKFHFDQSRRRDSRASRTLIFNGSIRSMNS